MSRRVEAALAVAMFLAMALAGVVGMSQAAPVTVAPTASPSRITLYGDATHGWGNTSASIANPGPTLYLHQGENVSMALYSADGAPHNWYIDYNNDQRWQSGTELGSPDFQSPAAVTWFNFTVPTDRIGEYTYRCQYHATLMTGTVVILSPLNLTLYGSVTSAYGIGWGRNNTSIQDPGPVLWILAGENVTLHLVSADGQPHFWFIAYDNGTGPVSGEPASRQFQASPIDYSFEADRTGTFTYRCGVHPTAMTGTIVIVGVTRTSAAPKIDLVPAIMIGTIAGVLVLAAIYQVRAVRAARRSK